MTTNSRNFMFLPTTTPKRILKPKWALMVKTKLSRLLPAIARIGHLLIQSRYLRVFCVRWWSSCHGTFSRTPPGAIILRCNSRYGSKFKIYTRRYARRKTRRKFGNSPATPNLSQERNNKWKKVSVLLFFSKAARRYRRNKYLYANNKSPTSILKQCWMKNQNWENTPSMTQKF